MVLSNLVKYIFCLCILLAYNNLFSQAREHILLDEGWKFSLGHATNHEKDFGYNYNNIYSKTMQPDGGFATVAFDDSKWQQVELPHDWAVSLPFENSKNTDQKSHGYKAIGPDYPQNSIGWYRRRFDVAAKDSGKRFELQFDGIFRNAIVWVNGMYVATNMSGYIGFKTDITDFIKFNVPNVVTVRVDATQYEGWFYEGAGIYRHVWLNTYNNLHTNPEDVFAYTTQLSPLKATLKVETKVVNNSFNKQNIVVENFLLDRNGRTTGKAAAIPAVIEKASDKLFTQTITVKNPKAWSIGTPYLYKLVTLVKNNHVVLDKIETRIGIRQFGYDADKGFLLNGKPVKIKGVCCHQDHAGVGAALPDELQYYRIGLLKEMGANAYRSSHNPPVPEIVEACDSLGMLVMDETRLLNSSEEYISQFERLIKRDRNHASVFMWCIGNENERVQITSIGKRIAQSMITVQQKLDPSRVSTYAANVGNTFSGINEVIPIRGFNYNLYGLDDYKKDHPAQPVIGTEVASTITTRGVYINNSDSAKHAGDYNGNFIADENSSYLLDADFSHSSWASTAEYWWKIAAKRDWFMGGFVWTGFDYRGEPTPFSWPNVNSHFGIMDMCGFPKNVYYYYQSWWGDKDVLHIVPHWNINVKKGDSVNVWVYSNAENVELFLNDKSLGKKQMPHNGHLNWLVAYEPGALKAVGYRHGKKIEKEIHTTAKPAKLILKPHKNFLSGQADAIVINVSVADADNKPVPDANNLINFEIRGGKIIGTGNGDPNCHEAEKGNSRSLFNGKCQIIIQPDDTDGEMVLQAVCNGIEGEQITIKKLYR